MCVIHLLVFTTSSSTDIAMKNTTHDTGAMAHLLNSASMMSLVVGMMALLLTTLQLQAQEQTQLQLMDNTGKRVILTPGSLSADRTITVPNVSGDLFIVSSSGGGGTANQLTRFGTTTGTLLDGSLSDNGTGTLTRVGLLTLSVSSLNVTGQTTFNSGTAGAFSMPTSRGANYDALTSNGAGAASFASVPPVGSVIMFGGATAPNGYLLCNGQAVSRTTYAALFAIIGTAYGAGDGVTTFNVPDMRSRFATGIGNGPGLTSVTRGATGGQESISQVPPHDHGVTVGSHTHTVSISDPGHWHGFNFTGYIDNNNTRKNADNTGAWELNQDALRTTWTTTNTTGITVSFANNNTGISVNNSGTDISGGNVDVMNPYTAVNFIIKY